MKLDRWCLAAGLALAATSTAAQNLLLVDAAASPGAIWALQGAGGTPTKVYEWEDQITSLGAGDGRLFFTDTSFLLYELAGGRQRVVYDARKQRVRDVAVRSANEIYFSFASGATSDGSIHRMPAAGGTPTLVYRVRLSQVGGSWSGHFALVAAGGREEPTIYLSTGMTVPGQLFRVRSVGGKYQVPESLARVEDHAITGLDIAANGDVYYADNAQGVWRLAGPAYGRPQLVAKLKGFHFARDVALAPAP